MLRTRLAASARRPLLAPPVPLRRPVARPASSLADAAAAAAAPKVRALPVRLFRWSLYAAGSVVFGLSATLGGVLLYDSFTYRDMHIGNVPAAPLALHPRPGGPKSLPVISDYVEGEESEAAKTLGKKERLVVVGGGWGAVALLSTLDKDRYNVTLVSPNNFYLFTPLLPSATVGTVEPRSLVEPLRKVLARVHGHYVQGYAVDAVMGSPLPEAAGGEQRLLEVEVVDGHGGAEAKGKRVYIPYDRLVVAVGSVSATHGVPGLEHCFQLKTIQDARRIRSHIMDNLEIAALPTTDPKERERLLSFVISGGGPTGVETAAEIYDMLNEDVLDYFPKLLRSQAKVHLIQSREHILNTYSEKISEYAEKKFAKDDVDIIVNARVKRVEPDKVVYTKKNKDGGLDEFEIPSGFTLWSTGIAMSPFTKRLTELLPNQSHLKALQIDSHLRVKGAPLGSLYALGDASTIDTRLIDYLYDFVEQSDKDHDGKLCYSEFQDLAKAVGRKFPIASKHFEKLQQMFETYDTDADGKLGLNEIADMFLETQNKMTALPATAQVASQQGKYLARKLNKLARRRDAGKEMNPHDSEDVLDIDDHVYRPFNYRNLGSLAYVGNAAAFDLPLPEPLGSWAGGLLAMYAWRSFYLSEQVSTRTRLLLLMDYVRRGVYGRDVSNL